MQVLVKTDNHIEGSEDLTSGVESEVVDAVGRFGEQVTRVEVYLNDLNSHKSGIDKRCLMEARIAGRPLVAVSHEADSLEDAITGAAEKLEKLLDHTFDRLGDHKGRTSFGGDQVI